MAEAKTRMTGKSVEEYLDTVASDRRRQDARTVLEMMRRASGEEPKMWGPSIIGFGRYRYRYDSGHQGESFLAGLAPRKQALTVYIMPGFDEFGDLMDRLGTYKVGKSCLYINKLESIDETVLEQLIARSIDVMRARYAS